MKIRESIEKLTKWELIRKVDTLIKALLAVSPPVVSELSKFINYLIHKTEGRSTSVFFVFF